MIYKFHFFRLTKFNSIFKLVFLHAKKNLKNKVYLIVLAVLFYQERSHSPDLFRLHVVFIKIPSSLA